MYFDLEHTFRTDGAFRDKIIKISQEFKDYSERSDTNSKYSDMANDKLRELIKICKHNFTFLLPYYFPRYPKMDPMSLKNFPFAYHIMAFNIGGYMVIRGSRQIAKSTTIAARQRLFAHILPKFKSIYIAPKTDQLATYANKFRDLEMAFRYSKQHHKFRQNLYLKEYANGSTIELFNVDTQVTNIRGKSADELIFDEYQNFDPEFEPEVSEIQSATEMPVTIFAGTSLTTDSALEIKYANSSQGVWVMTCGACNHDNIPLPEYNVMDMIQPKGVCCSKCGKLLDVTRGRFMHLDKAKFDQGQYGFHIPQIIVPFVVENKIRYSEIYRKKLEQDPRKFFQENLGIPTEEGEREITEGDLVNMCVLRKEDINKKLANNQYRQIISGCDWGGSDYDISLKTKLSYTVHVMMGLDIHGGFDIIHMKKYEGMSYKPIADDIMNTHHKYNGTAMGCDFGVGMAYNMLLRERLDPAKHLIFNYTGPTSIPIKENPAQFNQFSLNKTESITTLYMAIKMGRLRCYDWAIAKNNLTDLLNLYRVPTDNPAGSNAFVYRRHAAKADDTLHALNFAYVVGRLSRQEPIVEDRALLARVATSINQVDRMDSNLPQAFSG